MRPLLWLVVLLAPVGAVGADQGFLFHDATPDSIELTENGAPVYAYNHGMVLKAGAPESKRRCCYLHPVYTPNGVVVTDDFPKDHYHHRGIFWAWPVVEVAGARYDPWTVGGLPNRTERVVARDASRRNARLAVENGWYAGDRKVVREQVEIVAWPASNGRRELDFTLRLEATEAPVSIAGAPEQRKGYGGFSVRFASRQDTAVTTDRGREAKDSDMVPHPWAQLSARFGGKPAALRIDIDPSSAGFPNGWCLRYYGFLGVNFPGLESHILRPGAHVTLKYRVTLSDAAP